MCRPVGSANLRNGSRPRHVACTSLSRFGGTHLTAIDSTARADTDYANGQISDLEAVLDLLREPWVSIERAEETCHIDVHELRRSVSLTFAPRRQLDDGGDQGSLILVDLLRPRKGDIVDLEILNTGKPRAGRVSHDRHREISRGLIFLRFMSVWRSITLLNSTPETLSASMNKARTDLTRLPFVTAHEGVRLVETHFTRYGILRAVADAQDGTVNVAKMQGLYQLCRLLAIRYLVLAEVKVQGRESWQLNYEYHHTSRVSPDYTMEEQIDLPFAESSAARSRRPRAWLRGRFRRVFGAAPTWLRIHTPLAKRTDHYSLRVAAPENHFFSQALVLEDLSGAQDTRPPRSATAHNALSDGILVSVNFGRGVDTQFFVGSGRSADKRIYVGLVTKELPNHSAFRAALVLGITTSALIAFSLLAWAGAAAITEVASLVVALLAIGYLIIEAIMPRSGLQGAPILSGVLIAGSSGLSVLFSVWLVSLTASGPRPPWLDWGWGVLGPIWVFWTEWGAVCLIVIAFIGLITALVRCGGIVLAYVRVTESRPSYNNMNTEPEGLGHQNEIESTKRAR